MNHLFSMSGRANRQPYILHTLLDGFIVVFLLLLIFGSTIGLAAFDGGIISGLSGLLAAWAVLLAAFVAELCVTVRRLHDLDRSGWQWLLSFVPLLNIYIWFLLVFQPGTQGPNRYGPDPTAR